MSLCFPNSSRSYDPSRRSVSFWGHDAWTEITFDCGEDVLQAMGSNAHPGEAASLLAFDTNREQILSAAGRAYARRRQNFLKLQLSDF